MIDWKGRPPHDPEYGKPPVLWRDYIPLGFGYIFVWTHI